MSRTASTPESCAADLSRELAEAKNEGHLTIRRYVKTLIDESGWQKRSAPRLARLNTALIAEGLTANVDITDMDLSLDTWVRLARSPFWRPDPVGQFTGEDDLNQYVREHHEDAFEGIAGLEGLRFVAAEKPIPYDGAELIVDLVFEAADGSTVVVELEKGDPPRDSVMQLQVYLNAFKQQGKAPLRGVLITGAARSPQHELDVLEAIEGLGGEFPIEWYQYTLDITLERLD